MVPLIKGITLYMASPLGKELDRGTVLKHARHIKHFFQYSVENGLALDEALTAENASSFLQQKKLNNGKPLLYSTIRHYISSLQYVVKFLKLHTEIDNCPSPFDLERFSQQISYMSSGMKKGCMKENWMRQQRVMKKNLKCEENKAYLTFPERL